MISENIGIRDWGRCSVCGAVMILGRSGWSAWGAGTHNKIHPDHQQPELALSGISSPFLLSFLFEPFVFSLTRSGEKVRGYFRSTEVFTATILLLRVSSPPTVPLPFTRVSDSRLGQALRYCGLLRRNCPIRQTLCLSLWPFYGIHPFW